MKISETTLPFLEEDCLREFGGERGRALFQRTETLCRELAEHEDDRGSAAVRDHLHRKLFPPMAYYQALREAGFHQERALEYVRRETRKAAEAKREEMRRMARLPFAYAIYRLGVRRFMKRNFPEEGWRTEWVRCDGRELHFDLYRCLYWDVTQAHGCPELCCVYCENDDVSFSGLLPKIRFVRAGTLAKGAACCDFHFCRGK